jgi:type I restriction enzyme S subunit
MNAQQLKNAILQEAIEGRLVPQDPNDEPASALLARIRQEKEQLVKEGKLKKKDLVVKPISEDEIPFEIPESWEWVRLSTLSVAIHYGFTASAAPAGNAKLLRITDIQNDKVDWKSVPFCTTKENDLYTYQLKNRDILIARTGGTIGKTYIVRQLDEVAVFASYLIRVIPLDEVNEEFLKLFMMTPCYWKQLTDASSGTGQPNVNGQSLSNLILPIPPKEEQARILSKYEELLPKVEEYGKAQDALNKLNAELPERLKKSILQEAIEGRLVPQDPNDEPASVLLAKIRQEKEQLVKEGKLKKKDLIETPVEEDETPFSIPDNWKWIRFGDLVSTSTGKTPARGDVRYWGDNDYPWVSISDMKQGETIINTKEYVSAKAANDCFHNEISKRGTLIMSFKLTVGRTAILGIDAYHNEAIISIKTYADRDNSTRDYLSYILPIVTTWGDSKDAIKGKTLNAKSIYNLLIPLPPLAEQHRIVEKLEQLLGEIDKLKK